MVGRLRGPIEYINHPAFILALHIDKFSEDLDVNIIALPGEIEMEVKCIDYCDLQATSTVITTILAVDTSTPMADDASPMSSWVGRLTKMMFSLLYK